MKYVAQWQEYDRGPAPLTIIRFSAVNDEQALFRILKNKIIKDEYDGKLSDFLEDYGVEKDEITLDFLTEFFNSIDVSGWPFLVNLTNISTNEVVFDMGINEDDDWNDDDDEEDEEDEDEDFADLE